MLKRAIIVPKRSLKVCICQLFCIFADCKNYLNMRSLKLLVVALLSIVAFAACDKDKSASLALERTSLYFASWSDSAQSISYVASDATQVAIASYSAGWSASVDAISQKIKVWPIGATEEGMTNDDLPKEGSVVVNVLNKAGEATSYYISVYICSSQLLGVNSAANCYVINTPNVEYSFDAMHRHDGSQLTTESVGLLWQSNTGAVKNVGLVNGMASFYIPASDEDTTRVVDTNAVIAAYNADGDVIWSWHLWIVNGTPLAAYDTYSNGKSFMRLNLGAFTNANGSQDEQRILDSYGMYYQWGRKDPFPRPYYFDASGADDESRYNEAGTYIAENYVERTSSNGTIDYATKNPMVFITTADDLESEVVGNCDWLAPGYGDDNLWGENGKSLYDPCPYGWKVPSADDLSVLYLADAEDNTDLATARKQYGWHLSDGNNKYFWSACGRRRYTDGKVENMNYKEGVYPAQSQPWEGYYWTSSVGADGKAIALYFDLTTTRTINKFVADAPHYRANGFQIRCVKE